MWRAMGSSFRGAEYVLVHKPWSFSAFLIAFLVIICATTIQELMASFGIALHFAIFVPAILIAALVSGFPAGAFATLLTVPIVWWAFLVPRFEFNHLTATDYDGFAIFPLCSSLVICFSHLCREALAIRRETGEQRTSR
jgi:K+-sensing histidine kinase KdpD